MKYTHLTLEDRYDIKAGLKREESYQEIADQLCRCESTIRREVQRNSGRKGYRPQQAHRKAQERRLKAQSVPRKLEGELLVMVLEKLHLRWSPEQISGWLKRRGIHLSFQSIYHFIHRHAQACYQRLRHKGRKYRRIREHRGRIKNRRDIDERPPIVDKKTRFGDWEADLIVGQKHKGAVLTLVERTSKYTLLAKLDNREADTVASAILTLLSPYRNCVHTLTVDNGKEFAAHKKISHKLQCDVFFTKPYSAWQKGLVEHTNGLLRDYFPKTTNFLITTHQKVQNARKQINNRPRKVLHYAAPTDVFAINARPHINPALHT